MEQLKLSVLVQFCKGVLDFKSWIFLWIAALVLTLQACAKQRFRAEMDYPDCKSSSRQSSFSSF